jgi:hypothetical protein
MAQVTFSNQKPRKADYFACGGCGDVVGDEPVRGMWTPPEKSINAGCSISYRLCRTCAAAMANSPARMFEIVDAHMRRKYGGK